MRLRHARIELELHELSQRDGPTLLLLHALGGSSADWAEAPALWPGRVCALDFSGHGRSDWLQGGGYLPELLGVCDRIAVMCRGVLQPARAVDQLDEHQIMIQATGAAEVAA